MPQFNRNSFTGAVACQGMVNVSMKNEIAATASGNTPGESSENQAIVKRNVQIKILTWFVRGIALDA